jgi:nitrile hydratase accessory protein
MRNIVYRADGSRVHVPRTRGHLFVCADGCCCGRTADGFPPVPRERFHQEWERRGLRSRVHLTIGGCLGPCRLANVALLLLDGRPAWFHSINSEAHADALWDYAEQLLGADAWQPPPPVLAALQFTASTWVERPDGQPVEDRHLGARPAAARSGAPSALAPPPRPEPEPTPDRLVAQMSGSAALPRRNGELVFDAPWQGRVFGMAVALEDRRVYGWPDFQRRLIAEVARAERQSEPPHYYECWLRSFEGLLVDGGILTRGELEDRTEAFEFGERDELF